MKKAIATAAILALSSTTAIAACKTTQVNGTWLGTYTSQGHSGGTLVGICEFSVKGNRLLSSSFCTDPYGDAVYLRNTRVRLNKNACSMEIRYKMRHELLEASLTMDSGVTAAPGIYYSLDYGYVGALNMVKK